jgi:hypothetical protein
VCGLSSGQRTALAQIAADDKQLYKAYLMKEQLREAFKAKGTREGAAGGAPRQGPGKVVHAV